ncbi:helix-turn-helix transcriptional regulator [Actinokineospora sp. HUAS TT18]|uniref:helix-turn-helix transcriptional regulator n=1 Tax=Actinokineospora sp. HUAS TT18 TaxID=3447451 RepID=UPI003F526476
MESAGLVERESEFDVLVAAVAAVQHGRGTVVLLEGAAGIGKTALVQAACQLGSEADCQVLRARATELERNLSFGLVRQLFELPLAAAGHDERQRWLAGPAIHARDVIDVVQDHPAVGDFALLNGLYWLVANMAEDRPVVLALDDLHWADRASLRFLAFLLPRIDELPVIVIVSARPNEPGADQRMLELLTSDAATQVITPRPLTESGTAHLIQHELGPDTLADREFIAACHEATRGNPLLVELLARAVGREGIAPTGANAEAAGRIGAQALRTTMAVRMSQLPQDAVSLARAASVLGDDSTLALVGDLAGLSPPAAAAAAAKLQRAEVLSVTRESAADQVKFVHPLIRDAVYEQLDIADQMRKHKDAARILAGTNADPERVAAHVLRTPADGDEADIDTLKVAATRASSRGAPEAAAAYLDRCAQESLPPGQRLEVLIQLGLASMAVDLAKAIRVLRSAWDMSLGTPLRAGMAYALATALYMHGRNDESAEVFKQALAELEGQPDQDDQRRRLQANLLNATLSDPRSVQFGKSLVESLRDESGDLSLGSRQLDGIIALWDSLIGRDLDSIERAWRTVADEAIIGDPSTLVTFGNACWSLIGADDPRVMGILDSAEKQSSQTGSMLWLIAAKYFRCLALLQQGLLNDAIIDAQYAVQLTDVAQVDLIRPYVASRHSEILLEQGRLFEAEAALDWATSSGIIHPHTTPSYWLMDGRAKLLLAQGKYSESLVVSMECGRKLASSLISNPAFLPWRSTAAIALKALGRTDEAMKFSYEQLGLAKQWFTPRATGHSLRIAGLVDDRNRVPLLHQAVEALEESPAILERAKALVDLGAAMRSAGDRLAAKKPLSAGLDMALRCGAEPVAARAETELRVVGARPKRRNTGQSSLTISERRVAELAAQGLPNRQIAQTLFVTPKTVEVHLSSTYRKLGIARRQDLTQIVLSNSDS